MSSFADHQILEHKRSEHFHYVVVASDDHQITKGGPQHSTRIAAEINKLHLHRVIAPSMNS